MDQMILRTLYDYRPDGYLVHRSGVRAGERVGHFDREGYLRITLKGRKLYAHRAIWCWHYGDVPRMLDHRNRDKADNRIENLRPCREPENAANANRSSLNTSGYKGVYFDTDRGKWVARIRVTVDGVRHRHRIGRYGSPEEAAIHYNLHLRRLYPEFAFLNRVDTPLGRMLGMA